MPSVAYALSDLGQGNPWLGPISLAVLAEEAARLGLRIEPDPSFQLAGPISAYRDRARRTGVASTAAAKEPVPS